jgi:hypothetical protein
VLKLKASHHDPVGRIADFVIGTRHRSFPQMPASKAQLKFISVKLLVFMAIIATLLLPALSRVTVQAQNVFCLHKRTASVRF